MQFLIIPDTEATSLHLLESILPNSVIAGQYATSHCKPLLVMFM